MYSENGGTVRLFDDPPRVLVVGTAAQGIVKPLKHLVGDPSFIRGIEINPSVVDLMRNTFFEYSGRAYEGIAVRRIDARTFFAAPPEETFDVITLLNTFVSRDIGNSRRPDFIHTREALDRYLEFLEPDGLLLIEERDADERSRIAGYRLVNTLACLLEKRGARRPGDHFFLYRWNASPALHRFNRYLMAVVGKSPLSARRIDFFSKWLERRRVLETVERLSSVRTRPEHLPPGGTASPYSDFLNASDRDDFLGRGIDLSPATDDRPFLYDVYRQNDSFETLLRRNALAALALLALLLASLACSLRVRSYGSAFLFFVYFVMIGLGYLTLEFAFMNRYQKYTGSPSLSLVFILGVLLVSSGLGAFCSRRFSARTRTILLAAIPLVVLGHLGAGDSLVTALTGSAFRNGLLVASSLFPLGFLMGVPLPLGISEIKKRYGERPVPLFYASSCTASAFSILFAHAIMLDFGIKASLGAGAACYALALSLILMLS
jgi:hypothetical protein